MAFFKNDDSFSGYDKDRDNPPQPTRMMGEQLDDFRRRSCVNQRQEAKTMPLLGNRPMTITLPIEEVVKHLKEQIEHEQPGMRVKSITPNVTPGYRDPRESEDAKITGFTVELIPR